MKFYLLIKDNKLWNIYNSLPNPLLLESGISIQEVDKLPQGIKIGQVRLSDGRWVDPPTPKENWQAFMDRLDIPERGGNGGYALALAGPAKEDAMQGYVLALMFLRGVAKEKEKLTFNYHLQQVVTLQPELKDKLLEALAAGNIQGVTLE